MKMIFLFSLLFFFLVLGCATIPDGVEPLTADELRSILPGNSVYIKGQQFEYAGYYFKNGDFKGRAWGSWGEEREQGTWEITDDGLICYKYDKTGQEGNCRQLYPDKKKQNAYIAVNVSGKTRHKILTYNIVSGNKYKF